jgi:5'-3' exonuclease
MSVVRTKLLVVDAMSIVFRHHFAQVSSPMQRHGDGRIVSGLTGLCRTLLKYAKELQPTHIIVCLDSPGSRKGRQAVFTEYKANRPSLSDDLSWQLRQIPDVVAALGLPIVAAPPGWEADDVIADICLRAEGDRDRFAARAAPDSPLVAFARERAAPTATAGAAPTVTHTDVASYTISALNDGNLYLLGSVDEADTPVLAQPHPHDALPAYLPTRALTAATAVAAAAVAEASDISAAEGDSTYSTRVAPFPFPWPKSWPFVTSPRPFPSDAAAVAARDSAVHPQYARAVPGTPTQPAAAIAAVAHAADLRVETWDLRAVKPVAPYEQQRDAGSYAARQSAAAAVEAARAALQAAMQASSSGTSPSTAAAAAAPAAAFGAGVASGKAAPRNRALWAAVVEGAGTDAGDNTEADVGAHTVQWGEPATDAETTGAEAVAAAEANAAANAVAAAAAVASATATLDAALAAVLGTATAPTLGSFPAGSSGTDADAEPAAAAAAPGFSATAPMRVYFAYLAEDPLVRLDAAVPSQLTLARVARLAGVAAAAGAGVDAVTAATACFARELKQQEAHKHRSANNVSHVQARAHPDADATTDPANSALSPATAAGPAAAIAAALSPAGTADAAVAALCRGVPLSDALALPPLIDHTFILSYDKDFAQLVSPHTTLLRPAASARAGTPSEFLTPAAVEAAFQVPPRAFELYLALSGDASDNVPGVRGCGPIAAAAIARTYVGTPRGAVATALLAAGRSLMATDAETEAYVRALLLLPPGADADAVPRPWDDGRRKRKPSKKSPADAANVDAPGVDVPGVADGKDDSVPTWPLKSAPAVALLTQVRELAMSRVLVRLSGSAFGGEMLPNPRNLMYRYAPLG